MVLLRSLLARDEAPIAVPTLAVAALDAGLILTRGLPVDTGSLFGPLVLSIVLIGLSETYRRLRRSEEIALATGFAGWFVLFTAVAAVLNALLLPVRFPVIDPLLFRMDAALGWSWAGMVAFGAAHPALSGILGAVYASSLSQIALLVCALALGGRRSDLRELSGTLTLSAIATMGFWFFFPSFGPSSFVPLAPGLAQAAGLAVGPAYGADLVRLAIEGVSAVSLDHAKGLVAFPSFHTVMAAICVWHSRRIPWLRAILWPLNALMIPAILLHGGHHLVDLPAGLAVFGLALLAVRRFGGAEGSARTAASPRPA